MSKTLIAVIKLKDEARVEILTDSLNEVLRHPEIYNLLDDDDDDAWEYLESK
jgi:hypothetical protein